MTDFGKSVIALLGAVIIGSVIVGAYWYPKAGNELSANAGSPAGSTFTSAKVAQINLSPTNGATSTSVLNSDSSDRFVTDNFIGCTGATTTYAAVTGSALTNLGWIIKAATTSTSAPAVVSNTNLVMNDAIATGTVAAGVASDYGGIVLVASTSIATSSPFVNNAAAASQIFRWAAGSYLTFFSNATNTAACTVGVHYLAS